MFSGDHVYFIHALISLSNVLLVLCPVSILRPSYLPMAISMLKIRRPLGRLIFNMGIAIPGKTVFLIETAPWSVNTKGIECPYEAYENHIPTTFFSPWRICHLIIRTFYLVMKTLHLVRSRVQKVALIKETLSRRDKMAWRDNIPRDEITCVWKKSYFLHIGTFKLPYVHVCMKSPAHRQVC